MGKAVLLRPQWRKPNQMITGAKMLETKLISALKKEFGIRNYSNVWDLRDGDFFAFLAVIPGLSSVERTGLYIEEYFNPEINPVFESFKNTIKKQDPDTISLIMADLMTGISNNLIKAGKGKTFSTMILLLVCGQSIYVLPVGDSAVYIIGQLNLRISETNRMNGSLIINETTREELIQYKEHSYIGRERRYFTPKDVLRLPTKDWKLVALVSKGAEAQLGVKNLFDILANESNLDQKEAVIYQQLGGGQGGDVTIVLAEIPQINLTGKPVEIQSELLFFLEEQTKTVNRLKREIEIITKEMEKLNLQMDGKVNHEEYEKNISTLNESFENLNQKYHDLTNAAMPKDEMLNQTPPPFDEQRMLYLEKLIRDKIDEKTENFISRTEMEEKIKATHPKQPDEISIQVSSSNKENNQKESRNEWKKWVVAITILVFLCLILAVFFYRLFEEGPSLPIDSQRKTIVQDTGSGEVSTDKVVNENYKIYLAYLNPGLIKARRYPAESQNIFCSSYEDFEDKMDAVKDDETLLIPLVKAQNNWNKLRKLHHQEYRVNTKILTLKLISRFFIMRRKDFQDMQTQQGYEGDFMFRKGEVFTYSAFYYKVELNRDMPLKSILEKFDLASDEFEDFNRGIEFPPGKIRQGTFINIPLLIEPTSFLINKKKSVGINYAE